MNLIKNLNWNGSLDRYANDYDELCVFLKNWYVSMKTREVCYYQTEIDLGLIKHIDCPKQSMYKHSQHYKLTEEGIEYIKYKIL